MLATTVQARGYPSNLCKPQSIVCIRFSNASRQTCEIIFCLAGIPRLVTRVLRKEEGDHLQLLSRGKGLLSKEINKADRALNHLQPAGFDFMLLPSFHNPIRDFSNVAIS